MSALVGVEGGLSPSKFLAATTSRQDVHVADTAGQVVVGITAVNDTAAAVTILIELHDGSSWYPIFKANVAAHATETYEVPKRLLPGQKIGATAGSNSAITVTVDYVVALRQRSA